MRLLSIVGARPQFIKIAPVCRAIDARNATGQARLENFIVHTGQHYDPQMSRVFFSQLDIPEADNNLGVGSGSHAEQTAAMLTGIETLVHEQLPDMVVIYGDTNSTVAGALAAAKIGIPIAHVEAGLRSFDRAMPEEINRIVADHVANLNLAPTRTAMLNLKAEGLQATADLTGDVMLDAVIQNRAIAARQDSLSRLGLTPEHYALATIHRADNTSPERLPEVLEALNGVAARQIPVVFPIHPRTRAQMERSQPDFKPAPELRMIEPVGYLDMLNLLGNARLALTDSGGLQKEAFFLDVPCVTIRDTTEWLETVEADANVITGADARAITSAVDAWLEKTAGGRLDFSVGVRECFGDGRAAEHIVDALVEYHGANLGDE